MSAPLPETMAGVVLTGHGGLDRLVYRTDLPVPVPGPDDVLIRVRASSVNNTDINTRIGWYSKAVTGATGDGGSGGLVDADAADAGWAGVPLSFPRIQGADAAGEIVAVGERVSADRIGERIVVRTLMRAPAAFRPFECWTFGSECDGGFAQFAVAPAADTFAVQTPLSDAELGAIPCAYSTAENMLVRASVTGDDTVLVLGASGGVGVAAVQLAKLRGAQVMAVAQGDKAAAVAALGADRVVPRGASLRDALGPRSVSVVVDLVGGAGFEGLLDLVRRGGRYVTAGAIAGPLVTLDLRTLYLNDLTLFGCVAQEDVVFANLLTYLRDGRLRPRIARTFRLAEIHRAQELFLTKRFVGKIALVP